MKNLFHVPSSYNRDGFLDALKGFAIFAMVIGHAITWLYEPTEIIPPLQGAHMVQCYIFLSYVSVVFCLRLPIP